MAGEGAFASAIASLGGGMDQERDRLRLEARQALQDKLAQQKETDTRNRADFTQSLQAREAGLVPAKEVQGTYDRLSASPLDMAVKSIPLQSASIGDTPTADAPAAPASPPPALPAAIAPTDPKLSALGHAAGVLSTGSHILMPTSHGPQDLVYDYSQSKNARAAEQEGQKQGELMDKMEAGKDRDAARAAAAPVTLGAGQNRYDAQGNVIAGGPPTKAVYKAVQKRDGTWTSVDEATGLDPLGKPVQGMVPKDPNATQPKYQIVKDDKTGTYSRVRVDGPEGPLTETFVKGGAGGGGSLDADSRAKMMAQAKIDNATMKRIEARVLLPDSDPNHLDFGTAAGLAGAAQGAHGGPLNDAVSVVGNAAAGALDPDIQQYLTANSSYGRIMGNLQSKRYTDNQAQIEKTISGLKGNDLGNTVRYKQELRDASLNDVVPSGGTGGATAGKIDPVHFAQLSKEDQAYFRKQGRAP